MSRMLRDQVQKLSYLVPTTIYRGKTYVLLPGPLFCPIFYVWKRDSWEPVDNEKVPMKVRRELFTKG